MRGTHMRRVRPYIAPLNTNKFLGGPYEFGTTYSIPCVVREIEGKLTVIRLDPRDQNYWRIVQERDARVMHRRYGT